MAKDSQSPRTGMDPGEQLSRAEAPREMLLRPREQVTLAGMLLVFGLVQLLRWGALGWPAERVDVTIARRPPPRFQVPLNEADWPEWMLLPGIGEKRARALVALRDKRQGFRSVAELEDVYGIGPKTLAAVRPFVVERAETEAASAARRP